MRQRRRQKTRARRAKPGRSRENLGGFLVGTFGTLATLGTFLRSREFRLHRARGDVDERRGGDVEARRELRGDGAETRVMCLPAGEWKGP